jgi:thiamine biosynthesis lipoprotein
MTQFNFEAIGTVWQIDIYQDLSVSQEKTLLSAIENRIELFDKTYSRFRSDSLVTVMSKETGRFDLPDDAEKLFTVYYDLYKRTGGLFTPLVGNLISDAGYDASYSLTQKKELEAPPRWEDALEYHAPSLLIKQPVILDFGAGGKGYLVDLVSEVIELYNIVKYCIDAGGDILYKNTTPIRIGLENPENTEQVIGVCTIEKGSICGSAGNRRAWGTFTHIINPKTLTSPVDVSAVWVTAETAFIADALATCLFFVEPETLADVYTFEYVRVRSDNRVERSAGFSGEVFLEE